MKKEEKQIICDLIYNNSNIINSICDLYYSNCEDCPFDESDIKIKKIKNTIIIKIENVISKE